MADITCAPKQQCIIVEMPKKSPGWIEIGQGVEGWLTVVAILVGAWWAYRNDWIKTRSDARAERDLRERERAQQRQKLEWDQTQVARQTNEQFLDDREAQQALTLIDCDSDTCTLTDESEKDAIKKYTYDLKTHEDLRAMRSNDGDPVKDEKEVFLRDCFDAWFYWMATIEQYLQNGLIRQKDITFPSDYYLRLLRKDEDLYEACKAYVRHYRLSPNVISFMTRFEEAEATSGAATLE